eukprot:352351_1
MSSYVYIHTAPSNATHEPSEFPGRSNIHKSIQCSQLLKSVFIEIVNRNDHELLSALFFKILIPHLGLEKILQLVQSEIFKLFYAKYHLSTSNCESFIDDITSLQYQLDSTIHTNTNKLSISDIPNCILSHTFSFLPTLEVIKIESTSYQFFQSAYQFNAMHSLQCPFWKKLQSINNYNNWIPLQYFQQRFSNINKLYLNTSTFENEYDAVKSMKTFDNLIDCEIRHANGVESNRPLCLYQIISLENIFSYINHLIIMGSVIDLSFIKALSKCQKLSYLKLEYCKVFNDLSNNLDLWNNYCDIQHSIRNVKILEIVYPEFNDSTRLSLTFIRMLLHPNLQALQIDCTDMTQCVSDQNTEYTCPWQRDDGIQFENLKLKALDLYLPDRWGEHYTDLFMLDVVPFVKCLRRLTIRNWVGDYNRATQIEVIYKQSTHDIFELEYKTNNFLSNIVKANLDTLTLIQFDSGKCEHPDMFDREFWTPIFAMYDQCVRYPQWCKNVLKRFEFIVSDIFVDDCGWSRFQNNINLNFDFDTNGLYWLVFVERKINELARLFSRNDVCFVFEFHLDCCRCPEVDKETMDLFVIRFTELFSCLWKITPSKCGNGALFELNNHILNKQQLITDFL